MLVAGARRLCASNCTSGDRDCHPPRTSLPPLLQVYQVLSLVAKSLLLWLVVGACQAWRAHMMSVQLAASNIKPSDSERLQRRLALCAPHPSPLPPQVAPTNPTSFRAIPVPDTQSECKVSTDPGIMPALSTRSTEAQSFLLPKGVKCCVKDPARLIQSTKPERNRTTGRLTPPCPDTHR